MSSLHHTISCDQFYHPLVFHTHLIGYQMQQLISCLPSLSKYSSSWCSPNFLAYPHPNSRTDWIQNCSSCSDMQQYLLLLRTTIREETTEKRTRKNVPPSAENVLILSFIIFTNVLLSILLTFFGSPNAFRRSSSEGNPPNFASARIACEG